jgi:hypothetical protein
MVSKIPGEGKGDTLSESGQVNAIKIVSNINRGPLRARSAPVCPMAGQWDDGFTPSHGIRCEVAGDTHARRR